MLKNNVPEELQVFFRDGGKWGDGVERLFSKYETHHVFNYMAFEAMIVDGSYKQLEELRKWLKMQTGEYYDNGHFDYANIYGDPFVFQIYDHRIHIWDQLSHSLGVFDATVEGCREIKRVTEKWTQGLTTCHRCGEELKRHEIAGRFYAAFYCRRCWEEGWTDPKGHKYESMKAVEGRENYN